MLRRPLRSPIPAHMNIVELHLLLRHFVPRHLRQNVFHPRLNLLLPNHRIVARHQIHAILRPQPKNSRRIHLQVQLHIPLVKLRNLPFRIRPPPTRPRRNRHHHTQPNHRHSHSHDHHHHSPSPSHHSLPCRGRPFSVRCQDILYTWGVEFSA